MSEREVQNGWHLQHTWPVDEPDLASYPPCSADAALIKIRQVLEKLNLNDEPVLVQFWRLLQVGKGSYLLKNSNLPCVVTEKGKGSGLVAYRKASLDYTPLVDQVCQVGTGLIGRVALKGLAKCTQDVEIYSSQQQYPQLDVALQFGIKGSLALPVFYLENFRTHCLGVIELVTTEAKTNLNNEFKEISRALEVENLKTSSECLEVTSKVENLKSSESLEVTSCKKKRKCKMDKLNRECIERLMDMPISSAARNLEVSKSTLNKKCRALGIKVWPYVRDIGKTQKPKIDNLVVNGNPNPSYTSSSEVLSLPDQSVNNQIYNEDNHFDFGSIDFPIYNNNLENLVGNGNPNASYTSSSEVLILPDQSVNNQIYNEDNHFDCFPRNFGSIDFPIYNNNLGMDNAIYNLSASLSTEDFNSLCS